MLKAVLFLSAFLLYAQTISYDFALDDKIYITQNAYVQKGFSGLKEVWTTDMMAGYDGGKMNGLLAGGRYRPVSFSLHILEQEIHQNNAALSHLLNALLYGFLAVVLFAFAQQIFEETGRSVLISLIATLIFVMHPLHVEVVANVKSRDELLSALFGLLAVVILLRLLHKQKKSSYILAAFLFFIALLTKESAVHFIGVVFLSFLFLAKKGDAKSKWLKTGFALLVPTAVFLCIRSLIAVNGVFEEGGEQLLNQVYGQASATERISGILFVFGLGVKLLFFPYPLTHDYYPFHPFRSFEELQAGVAPYPQWQEWPVWSSGILVLVLLGMMFYGAKHHKKYLLKLSAFCIALFLATSLLYANIIFEIGSFFNERFLFLASMAPALFLGFVLGSGRLVKQKLGLIFTVVILMVYAGLSVNRSADWKNDDTLVLQDVKVSNGSARANLLAAEASLNLFRKNADKTLLHPEFTDFLEQGRVYGERALAIYPEFTAPLDILGNIYFEQHETDRSFTSFLAYYERKPEERVKNNLLFVAQHDVEKGNVNEAVLKFKKLGQAFHASADKALVYETLGKVYGMQLQQLDSSVFYTQKAIDLQPQSARLYENLGTAYAIMGQTNQALQQFLKAEALGIKSRQLYINIGMAYQQLGKNEQAQSYFAAAEGL